MKTVFDGAMCAHVWAQQSQEHGRSNGSLSFQGPTLYSYDEPIARIHDDLTLVTSRQFSVTTPKHVTYALRAVRGPWLRVPNLNPVGTGHARNLDYLVEGYRAETKRLLRSRDGAEPWKLDRLPELAGSVELYARTFGLIAPELDVEADQVAAVEAAARRDSPEAKAKRDKDRARREEREAAQMAERTRAWEAGETGVQPDSATVRLRVAGDWLETSKGARVPLEDAVRVFRFVAAVKARGGTWKRNGETLPVGHFQVDAIYPNGDFVAGCHTIRWEQSEKLAQRLGLLACA